MMVTTARSRFVETDMADDLCDGEFWLPPEFLTEDDLLLGFESAAPDNNHFLSGLDLGSPVESVLCSTETESSDGEDFFLPGLTQKLALSTLHDHFCGVAPDSASSIFEANKKSTLSGSPQSTLCDFLGGYVSKQGSSRGSPNYPSQVSSPPAVNRKEADAWDLLCKAADEVARMRMLEDASRLYQNRALFGTAHHSNPVSFAASAHNFNNHNVGFHSEHSTYQQLQATQFQQLKQQQMMKQQHGTAPFWGQSKAQPHRNQSAYQLVQNRERAAVGGRPLDLPMSAWPTLQQSQQQQKSGSGMRAVFLGNHGTKRECAGTGVFLPRRIGTPTESRKKPACSTVLLPERVVQALNLNLEAVDAPTQILPRSDKACHPEHESTALKYRNNNAVMGQPRRRNMRPNSPQSVINGNDFRLPQEWTY